MIQKTCVLTTDRYARFCLFIRDIFRNIFQTAAKSGTNFVKSLSLSVFVDPQSAEGFTVDATLFAKKIGGDISLLHDFSKSLKTDHCHTSSLLIKVIMGVIIFFY